DDGARPVIYVLLDLAFVEVQGVGADVGEPGGRTVEGERVGGGDERERRDNDLVPRSELEEERAHLERVGTRRRQQGALATGDAFECVRAARGRRAVA